VWPFVRLADSSRYRSHGKRFINKSARYCPTYAHATRSICGRRGLLRLSRRRIRSKVPSSLRSGRDLARGLQCTARHQEASHYFPIAHKRNHLVALGTQSIPTVPARNNSALGNNLRIVLPVDYKIGVAWGKLIDLFMSCHEPWAGLRSSSGRFGAEPRHYYFQ
jgi:hypothetical protein